MSIRKNDFALRRLIVVGAGAVGGSVGGLVANLGKPVVLVARGEHGHKLRDSGLLVRMPSKTVVAHPEVVERIEDLSLLDGDVVMFATKLQDASAVMDQWLQFAGTDIPVICANNGVHAERWASERFATVISMLIWMPAEHLVPGEVSLFASDTPGSPVGILDNGPIKDNEVGLAGEVSKELSEWLTQAGFDAVSRDDMMRWKHAKWITNLGNAAQALVEGDWKSIAKLAQAEGEAILEAAQVPRVSTRDLLDRCKALKLSQIDGQSRKGGSSWQSFHRGQAMETPWLEGAMADLADQFGIDAPVLRYFRELTKQPRRVTVAEVMNSIV